MLEYGRQSDGNRENVPREEIEIKPNMSGIIDKILVKEGDKSYYGAINCYSKIVPSVSQVNAAQQDVQNANLQINNAKANLATQQQQFNMQQRLYNQGVISKQNFLTAQQNLLSMQNQLKMLISNFKQHKNLQIARTGWQMVYKV